MPRQFSCLASVVRVSPLVVALASLHLLAAPARAAREVPLAVAAPAEASDSDGEVLDRVRASAGRARPQSRDLARLTDLFLDRPLDAAVLLLERTARPRLELSYVLARALEASDRPEEALRHFQRALEAAAPGSPQEADLTRQVARLRAKLRRLQERPARCPHDRAALFAIEDEQGQVHPDRRPLLLVHGYNGGPDDLQRIVERLRALPDEQIYVACYESRTRPLRENAHQIAAMIETLRRAHGGRQVELALVAHSLGGLVTRMALNELALTPGHPLSAWSRVSFVAVDSPWHGYVGPPDHGVQSALLDAVRPLIPRGIVEMRALSDLFVGDPQSPDPLWRAGLFGVELPEHVDVHLVFAADGDGVLSYEKGVLSQLPARLVDWYRHDRPIVGNGGARGSGGAAADPRLVNFWRAMLSAAEYPEFARRMRDLADAGRLDTPAALALLEEHFPIFPGNHRSILDDQPRARSFLDHLVAALTGAWPRRSG